MSVCGHALWTWGGLAVWALPTFSPCRAGTESRRLWKLSLMWSLRLRSSALWCARLSACNEKSHKAFSLAAEQCVQRTAGVQPSLIRPTQPALLPSPTPPVRQQHGHVDLYRKRVWLLFYLKQTQIYTSSLSTNVHPYDFNVRPDQLNINLPLKRSFSSCGRIWTRRAFFLFALWG